MRVLRLAAVNALAFRRRYVGLALLTLIGVGICLPLLSIAGQADGVAQQRVKEGVALRSIAVTPQPQVPGGAALTPQGLSRIAELPDVSAVEPTMQATFGIKTDSIPGALLHAGKLRPSMTPPVVDSVREDLFPLAGDEAVLPASAQGMDLRPLLGTTVTVDYQQTIGASSGRGVQDQVHVVGLYDASWQLEGPDVAFVSDPLLIRWASSVAAVPEDQLLTTVGWDKATVLTDRSEQVDPVLRQLQGMGFAATSLEQQLSELPSVLKLIHGLSRVFCVVIFVFLVLASATLSGALVRQRTREIGLLKAIGYRNRAVLTMFLLESSMIGAVFALLGIGAGALLSVGAGRVLDGYPDLSGYVDATKTPTAGVLAVLIVLPVVAVALGSLRPAVRGALLEPSLALRDW